MWAVPRKSRRSDRGARNAKPRRCQEGRGARRREHDRQQPVEEAAAHAGRVLPTPARDEQRSRTRQQFSAKPTSSSVIASAKRGSWNWKPSRRRSRRAEHQDEPRAKASRSRPRRSSRTRKCRGLAAALLPGSASANTFSASTGKTQGIAFRISPPTAPARTRRRTARCRRRRVRGQIQLDEAHAAAALAQLEHAGEARFLRAVGCRDSRPRA
jgi:hypothetical protein